MALGRIGDEAALPVVFEALDSKHPDVRLRIGREIYEVRLSQVDDPRVLAEVLAAYATKYSLPNPPAADAPPVRYWEVMARS